MTQYETIFIYSPDFPAEKATAILDKVKSIITQDSGEIISLNEWGKRRLAYRISGQSEGVYVMLDYKASGKAVSGMESYFRVTEGILRYLTVKKEFPKKNTGKEAKPAAEQDVNPDKAAPITTGEVPNASETKTA